MTYWATSFARTAQCYTQLTGDITSTNSYLPCWSTRHTPRDGDTSQFVSILHIKRVKTGYSMLRKHGWTTCFSLVRSFIFLFTSTNSRWFSAGNLQSYKNRARHLPNAHYRRHDSAVHRVRLPSGPARSQSQRECHAFVFSRWSIKLILDRSPRTVSLCNHKDIRQRSYRETRKGRTR